MNKIASIRAAIRRQARIALNKNNPSKSIDCDYLPQSTRLRCKIYRQLSRFLNQPQTAFTYPLKRVSIARCV
ncbi:MAG: hypothetical protein Q8M12_02900, partial [bacterium]|nr:hypothetical protein [bacterium]